jgi:hypothetical protein
MHQLTDDVAITATNTDNRDEKRAMQLAIYMAEGNLRNAEMALTNAIAAHPEYHVENAAGLFLALRCFYRQRLADVGRVLDTETAELLAGINVDVRLPR